MGKSKNTRCRQNLIVNIVKNSTKAQARILRNFKMSAEGYILWKLKIQQCIYILLINSFKTKSLKKEYSPRI